MARKKPQVPSVWQFMARFPTDEIARKHLEQIRWGDSPICPKCGSRRSSVVKSEKPAPYRCKDCRKYFSVTTDTVFHSSNLSPSKCLYAMYLLTVAKKSISSCQLARELGVTQKTAWYLAQRIHQTWLSESSSTGGMSGEIEVDEAYFGGKEQNKHRSERLNAGRGVVGKTAVVGTGERKSGRVTARPISGTDAVHIQSAVRSEVRPGATIYSDDHGPYRGLHEYHHEIVEHSVGEYVRGKASTNGIESFWALLKRAYIGIFHRLSKKHLGRYVDEFATRHNRRHWDTIAVINQTIRCCRGPLGYKNLIAS